MIFLIPIIAFLLGYVLSDIFWPLIKDYLEYRRVSKLMDENK